MNEPPAWRAESMVDARLRVAVDRLERRLSAEEIATVRARIERHEAVLRRLRAVPLANSDEPASVFGPSPPVRAEPSP